MESVFLYLSEAVEHWNVITDHLNPPTIVDSQRNWDILNSRRILDSLSSSYTSDIDQARLLALQVKESGSFLRQYHQPILVLTWMISLLKSR